MLKGLVCPISSEKIDSNISRLTIFISIIFVSIFIFTREALYLYVPVFDYFIRAFTRSLFSPLRFIATKISIMLGWSSKMIDKAPKVFASRLGFLCLFASLVLIKLGLVTSSLIIAGIASTLFLLDALDVVCVGCLIYHHLVFPLFRDSNT